MESCACVCGGCGEKNVPMLIQVPVQEHVGSASAAASPTQGSLSPDSEKQQVTFTVLYKLARTV